MGIAWAAGGAVAEHFEKPNVISLRLMRRTLLLPQRSEVGTRVLAETVVEPFVGGDIALSLRRCGEMFQSRHEVSLSSNHVRYTQAAPQPA